MKINIKSTDIHNQSYNQIFELAKVVGQDSWQEFHYNDEHGKCRIVRSEDGIEIYRRGEINSRQVFKLNEKTSFTYITKEFKGKYKIFTKKLSIKDGNIMLEYDIMDNSEVINKINLEIVYLKI